MAERFKATRWTLVLSAGRDDSERSREALAELCRLYWPPLFAFARARGSSVEDAQDQTQAFFERLIEHHDLAAADPARGRFRSFLLASFTHFLANERDRARTIKRGGRERFVPLDGGPDDRVWVEPATAETPESLYERQWATTLLWRALNRLGDEVGDTAARRAVLDHLRATLAGTEGDVPLHTLAAAMGTSDGAARVALHRMRQRLRQVLLDEIAQTVADRRDVDDELRHMMAVLAFGR